MAYTILIKPDNSAIATIKQTIMQREKLVNTLKVVTARNYNDYDMSEFQLVMTYKTPISKTIRTTTLSIADDNYDGDNNFLSYTLDVDTGITQENGDVEIYFMFVKVSLDPDTGENIQQVRNIDTMNIHVCQLSDLFSNVDQALGDLAEIYLRNQQIALSLDILAKNIYDNSVGDLAIDSEKLVLMNNNGGIVGSGVSLEELNDELVEIGSNTSGNANIITI